MKFNTYKKNTHYSRRLSERGNKSGYWFTIEDVDISLTYMEKVKGSKNLFAFKGIINPGSYRWEYNDTVEFAELDADFFGSVEGEYRAFQYKKDENVSLKDAKESLMYILNNKEITLSKWLLRDNGLESPLYLKNLHPFFNDDEEITMDAYVVFPNDNIEYQIEDQIGESILDN